MSRSGYTDDCDGWDLIRWRGAVASAIRGARGQLLLRDLATAMDAMPVKELVRDELQVDGYFCALGVVGAARGADMSQLDPYDREGVAKTFGVAEALAAEIMYVNDENGSWVPNATARLDREERWRKVRAWVSKNMQAK